MSQRSRTFTAWQVSTATVLEQQSVEMGCLCAAQVRRNHLCASRSTAGCRLLLIDWVGWNFSSPMKLAGCCYFKRKILNATCLHHSHKQQGLCFHLEGLRQWGRCRAPGFTNHPWKLFPCQHANNIQQQLLNKKRQDSCVLPSYLNAQGTEPKGCKKTPKIYNRLWTQGLLLEWYGVPPSECYTLAPPFPLHNFWKWISRMSSEHFQVTSTNCLVCIGQWLHTWFVEVSEIASRISNAKATSLSSACLFTKSLVPKTLALIVAFCQNKALLPIWFWHCQVATAAWKKKDFCINLLATMRT